MASLMTTPLAWEVGMARRETRYASSSRPWRLGASVVGFGVDLTSLKPGYFGSNHRCAAFEILRTIFGPDLEPAVVDNKSVHVQLALPNWVEIMGPPRQKCSVKMIPRGLERH